MTEQLADESNQVSVDDRYRDQLGNYRPVLTYSISDYTKAGVAYGRQLAQKMFARLGAKDCTHYSETDFGYFTYEGQGYSAFGGNHFAGTHIMGKDPATSVVNQHQKSWDYPNLYLVGAGSSVSIGTSNPTLTLTALAFLAAEGMLVDLEAR
jgi:choline dehydrogenase-like flavoprotein